MLLLSFKVGLVSLICCTPFRQIPFIQRNAVQVISRDDGDFTDDNQVSGSSG